MAAHPSESDIVGRTVRQAEYLEDIDSVDEIDILEVNYTVSGQVGVTGVELVLCVGGPDIRANAFSGNVRGSWAGETHTTHFESEIVKEYARMLADGFEERHGL